MIEIPIRQSWLNTLSNCPEWARQDRMGLVTQKESSDMLRGNLVHGAIEHVGRLMILGDDPPFEVMLEKIDEMFAESVGSVDVWRDSHERVIEVARNNSFAWYEEVRPLLDPVGVEEPFRLTLDERDGVRLVITGTADWHNRD